MKSTPKSFRLTEAAARNLANLAATFETSESEIINILLSEPLRNYNDELGAKDMPLAWHALKAHYLAKGGLTAYFVGHKGSTPSHWEIERTK